MIPLQQIIMFRGTTPPSQPDFEQRIKPLSLWTITVLALLVHDLYTKYRYVTVGCLFTSAFQANCSHTHILVNICYFAKYICGDREHGVYYGEITLKIYVQR